LLVQGFPAAAAKFTESNADVYETMLLDLDFELAKRAVARLLNTATFLPAIAEIRKAAADLQIGPTRAGGEAWGDVQIAICRAGGRCVDPEFSDPVVADTVRALGWRNLWDEQNPTADRARFVDLYDRLAARRRADVASGIPLPAGPACPVLPARRRRAPELPADTDERVAPAQVAAFAEVIDMADKAIGKAVIGQSLVQSNYRGRPVTAEDLDAALAGKP
jgi:hypothetical protein